MGRMGRGFLIISFGSARVLRLRFGHSHAERDRAALRSLARIVAISKCLYPCGEAESALHTNPLKSNSINTKTIYSLSALDIRILGRNDILEKYVNKLETIIRSVWESKDRYP